MSIDLSNEINKTKDELLEAYRKKVEILEQLCEKYKEKITILEEKNKIFEDTLNSILEIRKNG